MNTQGFEPRKSGTYKGTAYKGADELEAIAGRVVELLRAEGLPLWQANDVLKIAETALEWEVLK